MPDNVIFRTWRDGDVIALFPDIDADCTGLHCGSYMHIGQHGAADYRLVVQRTRPAVPVEYAELKAELEQIGYVLDVRSRR